MTTSTEQRLGYVYTLEDADDMTANLAVETYISMAVAQGTEEVELRGEVAKLLREAQAGAKSAGWEGNLTDGAGVDAGPFLLPAPGQNRKILAVYWKSESNTTFIVSVMLMPYLGTPRVVREMEIYSPEFPYNMKSWMAEKITSQLRNAVRAHRALVGPHPISEDDLETALSGTEGGLSYGTKLLSFAAGARWSHEDVDLVLEGPDGLDELQLKYGLIEETPQQAVVRQRREYFQSLLPFLEQPRVPGLSALYEALRYAYPEDHTAEGLRSLVDKVQMGDIDWPACVEQARLLLNTRLS